MACLGIKSLLVASVLLTTVNCQQQPIVLPSTVASGQTFTVSCDANRVNIPSSVTAINSLIISRTVPTTPVETQITFYNAYTPPGLPGNGTPGFIQGRDWNFTFTGSNGGVNNKNTMKIVWEVRDAKCEDAGSYRCQVNYYSSIGQLSLIDQSSNLTVTAGTSNFELKIEPETEGLVYSEGENITLSCNVRGPNTVQFGWELWVDGMQGEKPVDATEVRPTRSPIGTGGCVVYDMQSILTFQVTANNPQETYKCIVSIDGIDFESGNITIGKSGGTSGHSQLPSTGPSTSGTDVGMIVGIVIGCVALIAIIIIIIFVVVYRRRHKEDNYKDNRDQPDANTDNNLHAPPPVFYSTSKPAKIEKESKAPTGMTNEALDNSYDSRDSGSKGPPRYINADDAQGPPRYEKESHRGRSNRGYDDEDRDKNGGRRQPKEPREHDEPRKHRSRGHDDGSRHHRYNADDGTVGNIQYGDPDMGTSI